MTAIEQTCEVARLWRGISSAMVKHKGITDLPSDGGSSAFGLICDRPLGVKDIE